MASAMRKMAVYLGLVEDDHRFQEKYESYGEYEEYEESGPSAGRPGGVGGRGDGWLPGPRVASRAAN
jgi:cell division inhibitor SepF